MNRLAVVAVLAALMLAGFFIFPGHTFLGSDTQIYLPILEHLRDSSLYTTDPVAIRPHVSYTIYDEMALAGRRLFGLDSFYPVLAAQQWLYRLAGLAGAFLIGTACGLSASWALLLASLYGLGATIGGPSVLILEYEPVPRGYAGPLLVCAIGLAAHARWLASGLVLALAILYHPPTTIPVLICGTLAVAFTRREALPRMAFPVAAAIALTWLLSKLQAGEREPQRFLGTIDAELERLQRLRGSYNWVSMWWSRWATHWIVAFALCLLMLRRLGDSLPLLLRRLFLFLPVYGLLSIPLSYVLLEQLKWTFMPQLQPARAVLYVTLTALLLSGLNGIRAAQRRRWPEAVASLFVAYLLPILSDLSQISGVPWRAAVAAALALIATAAVGLNHRTVLLAVALAAPYYAIPRIAQVRNYPVIEHAEMDQLVAWARANTAKDDVFLFPDADTALHPGLFRVYALRTVYVDWKGGGQVNLLRDFAFEWWKRWQASGAGKFDPAKLKDLSALGIRYIVVKPANRVAGVAPAFENSRHWVMRLN